MPCGVAHVGGNEAVPYNDSDEDSDDDESGEESPGETHKCPGCINIYANQMGLNVYTSHSILDPPLLTSE